MTAPWWPAPPPSPSGSTTSRCPTSLSPPVPPPPLGPGVSLVSDVNGYSAFHNDGVEHRFVAGSFIEAVRATDWISYTSRWSPTRSRRGCERVAAAADFGNGVSRVTSFEALTFINPDLTEPRPHPTGEWICIDAESRLHRHGIGIAETALYDQRGRIGRSVQSLLVS